MNAVVLTKELHFKVPSAPDGMGIVIYRDQTGWYYLKALVQEEGFATPFASVDEIEMLIGEKLTPLCEVPLSAGQT